MVEGVYSKLVVEPTRECLLVKRSPSPLGWIRSIADLRPERGENRRLFALSNKHRQDLSNQGTDSTTTQRPTVGWLPSRIASAVRSIYGAASDLGTAVKNSPVGVGCGDLGVIHRSTPRLSHFDDLECPLAFKEPRKPSYINSAVAHLIPIISVLNPDYCELAARRLAQQSIFSLGGEL